MAAIDNYRRHAKLEDNKPHRHSGAFKRSSTITEREMALRITVSFLDPSGDILITDSELDGEDIARKISEIHKNLDRLGWVP